jgi:hypothetical protein
MAIVQSAFESRLKGFITGGKGSLPVVSYTPADIAAEMPALDAIFKAGLSAAHMAADFVPSAAQVTATATNVLNMAGTTPLTEVNGSMFTTISTWVVHTAAGACAGKILASSSATTGDYATWRMRARSDAAVANTPNVASVAGVNSSASCSVNDYANLIGVAGLAQPNAFTQANTTNIICGVYSCLDRTGTHAGSAWSMWIDDHSTTSKAGVSHYLLRMSQNALGGTPVDIDGAITVQTSRLPVLFNFEQIQGFLSDTPGTLTPTHKIAVNIAGVGVRYIQVGTVA